MRSAYANSLCCSSEIVAYKWLAQFFNMDQEIAFYFFKPFLHYGPGAEVEGSLLQLGYEITSKI